MMYKKASNKVQYQFMIKTLSKLIIEGNYFNVIKAIWVKSKGTSYLMVKIIFNKNANNIQRGRAFFSTNSPRNGAGYRYAKE